MTPSVVVHPLVLLSVVDHYSRVAKNTNKRVVGVLLGTSGDEVNITNSFALPFEEDERDQSVFFLDQDFLTSFFAMFRKVNAKERVVGWYHTHATLQPSDKAIHALLSQHCPSPILLLVSVQPSTSTSIPAQGYSAQVQISTKDGTPREMSFVNLGTRIGAEEAEEIGVEQLLRDIQRKDTTALGVDIGQKLQAQETLAKKLESVHAYLAKVVAGERPVHQGVCYALQDMLNVLPVPNGKSVTTTTNDQMGVLYLGGLGRCVGQLHSLIDNKIANEV